MKDLLEMVKVIGPKQLRQTNILTENQNTQISKLYEELRNNGAEDEVQLAEKLFNLKADSSLFRQLKSKLKNRLINNLFLIDVNQPQFKSMAEAYQNCRKIFYAAEILYAKGARTAARKLAEKAFRVGEKYDFIEICEGTSNLLRNSYRTENNQKKLKFYRAKCIFYFDQLITQKRVINIYQEIIDDLEFFKEYSKDDYKYLAELEEELQRLLVKTTNPRIITYVYTTLCTIKFLLTEFDSVVSYSEKAINQFKKMDDLPGVYNLVFYQHILKTALSINDFNLGKKAIQDSSPILKKIKGLNKIFMLENYMQLALRTGNYEAAVNLYLSITKDPIWKNVPRRSTEVWDLFAAYLSLLQKIKSEDFTGVDKFTFKIGKFMNSAIELKKDKLGFNLSFLFFQILYFLHRKDNEEVMNCLDRLNSYNYRYLKKEEPLRAQYFVKMMLKIQEANFHKAAVIRKSKRWFDLLLSTKQANSGQSFKSEVIPFELHWALLLELLENKFKRKRSTLRS